MIISASRRTDLPAFYCEWFFRRLQQGFALVRNPVNPGQVRRISLTPESVDCFVFWSKNPSPLLARVDRLEAFGRPCGIGFTLNSYGREIEPALPPEPLRLRTFRTLARRLGPERMSWRYDPIAFSNRYDTHFHIATFRRLAEALAGSATRCIISFLDFYPKCVRNLSDSGFFDPPDARKLELAAELATIGAEFGFTLEACAESLDLAPAGIRPAACIGKEWIEAICNEKTENAKDANQRPLCNCVAALDLGANNSCSHGCRYCYANRTPESARSNARFHNPDSPFLIGEAQPGDRIVDAPVKSIISNRLI